MTIASKEGAILQSGFHRVKPPIRALGAVAARRSLLLHADFRSPPILMTALAAGPALLPIVVGGNKPGHEIKHLPAVVILGGLAPSTILNLFQMPALYLRFGKSRCDANDDSAR